MITAEGIKMMAPGIRFNPMSGILKHEGGRCLNMNGVTINVPKIGCAFVGIQQIAINGYIMTCARELTGSAARRFGAMRLGENELQSVKDQTAEMGGDGVPFVFSFGNPRPKISVN